MARFSTRKDIELGVLGRERSNHPSTVDDNSRDIAMTDARSPIHNEARNFDSKEKNHIPYEASKSTEELTNNATKAWKGYAPSESPADATPPKPSARVIRDLRKSLMEHGVGRKPTRAVDFHSPAAPADASASADNTRPADNSSTADNRLAPETIAAFDPSMRELDDDQDLEAQIKNNHNTENEGEETKLTTWKKKVKKRWEKLCENKPFMIAFVLTTTASTFVLVVTLIWAIMFAEIKKKSPQSS